jgi:hypothetical protein
MRWCLTSVGSGRAGRGWPVLPPHWANTLAAVLVAWLIGCGGSPAPDRGDAPAVREREWSLREVLSSRALVGNRVRVTGRCLAPIGPQPLGQPPRPWNEWQLEADGVAMFVIGPMPGACLVPGERVILTIEALVAEDTLPAIGNLPGAPRRFLVLLGVEPEGEPGRRRGG